MINGKHIVLLSFGIVGGFIFSALLIIMAFAGGQTFGQRCSEEYQEYSQEWCECVERLSEGGEVKQ